MAVARVRRVLMVSSSYPPIVGGLERNLYQLCQRLCARGVKVTVLTRRWPDTSARQDDNGVEVVRLAAPGGGLGFIAAALAWLMSHGRGFDVVHCHQALSPALVGVLGKFLHHAPVLVLVVAAGAYGEAATIRTLPLLGPRLALLKKVDRFLTLTKESAAELAGLGLGAVPVTQIPNGVDTAAFAPSAPEQRPALRRELGLGEFQRLLVFVGRLDEVKNLPWLLKAWAKVAPGHPGAGLMLVGEGPQSDELQGLVTRLGLESRVVLAGARDDVPRVLAAADGFVLVSVSEGMPNALLEAMAAGLPSLVTAVGAMPDMISHGACGLVVPPGDDAALAKGLDRLLAHGPEAAAMGAAARQRAVDRHDFEVVTSAIIEIYQQEMGRQH